MMRVLPAPPIAQLIRRGAPVTATLVVSQLTTGFCDLPDVTAGPGLAAGRGYGVPQRSRAIVGSSDEGGGNMVVAELAVTAANALVQAVVTDGWEGVRRKVARLFGRGEQDRAIERRLDATRQQLAAASPAEVARAQGTLAAQWQTRFEDLLADHPDVEADLAALVEELKPLVASAVGHSVAAAGDVNVKADHGSVAAGVIHGNVHAGPTRPGPASS